MAIIEVDFKPRPESSFERANRLAAERKAAAWAAYTPLPREAFVDDWLNPARVTISVVSDTGTRSTFGRAQKRSTAAVVTRPTEVTATANCYAGQGEAAIVVIRLERDSAETRKCAHCMRVLTLDKFARDKRFVSGYSFYCKRCRKERKSA